MTQHELILAAQGLQIFGGDFNLYLGKLYISADAYNRVALATIFHSYFEQGLDQYDRCNSHYPRLGNAAGS